MTVRDVVRSFLIRALQTKRNPAGAVFIDMLNVVNRDKMYGRRPLKIAWSKLRAVLDNDIAGCDRLHAAGYHFPTRYSRVLKRWLAQTEPAWRTAGYTLVPGLKDDTDSNMVADILLTARRAELLGYRKLVIVIVSGDGIFAEKYRALKKEYKGTLSLKVVFYSWKELRSGQHLLVPGPKILRDLESIKGLERPTSSEVHEVVGSRQT